MRRRTSAPSRKSAMPSWYLPLSRFCSSRPSETSVTASRWTVLFASPRRRAERADADFDLVLRERLEQPDRGRDRGQPLASSPPVGVAGCFLSRHPLLAIGAPEA